MSDLQTALLGLQEKLQALLKRQLALEKENHQLKGTLAEHQLVITQLQNDLKKLDAMTCEISLSEVQQKAIDILAGNIRGRLVVDVNRD